MVSLRLLGSVELFDHATSVSIPIEGDPAKKAAAWLALRPNEFYEREIIAEELWPGGTRDSMLNSLRRGLTSLRGALSRANTLGSLRVSGPRRSTVGLFDIATDLTAFRIFRDTGQIGRAISVISGRPLDNISSQAGIWVEALREALTDEVSAVLVDCADDAITQGDYTTALTHYNQTLGLAPANEKALRGAAMSLVQLDRRTEAVLLLREREIVNPLLEAETLDLKQTLAFDEHPERSPIGGRTIRPAAVPSSRYVPTHSFDGDQGFGNFNELLSADLADSRTYTFRGISAKYVPARLIHRGAGLDIVRLILVDPSATEVLRLRAIDRHLNPKYRGQSVEQLATALRKELLRSLVMLFDVRAYGAISIALVSSTVVDRVELTDVSAWVSVYRGERSAGQSFPETMRFAPDAAAYDQARYDCLRQFELAQTYLHFKPSDDEGQLALALHALGINLAEQPLAELRASGSRFTTDFLKVLDGSSNVHQHTVAHIAIERL